MFLRFTGLEPRFFWSPRHPSIEITWWEICPPQDFSAYKGVGFSIYVDETDLKFNCSFWLFTFSLFSIVLHKVEGKRLPIFFWKATLYFANINFREHKFLWTLIFANFSIGKFGHFANIYFREFWKLWRIYPQLMIIFSKKMLTRPVLS